MNDSSWRENSSDRRRLSSSAARLRSRSLCRSRRPSCSDQPTAATAATASSAMRTRMTHNNNVCLTGAIPTDVFGYRLLHPTEELLDALPQLLDPLVLPCAPHDHLLVLQPVHALPLSLAARARRPRLPALP